MRTYIIFDIGCGSEWSTGNPIGRVKAQDPLSARKKLATIKGNPGIYKTGFYVARPYSEIKSEVVRLKSWISKVSEILG